MKILKSIIPQRIKTKEQLAKFVKTAHTPAKIFGMEFRPRFVLHRDVTEFGAEKLEIPKNTIVRYRGEGNAKTGLKLSENATLRASKAEFADTETNGKWLALKTVNGRLSSWKGFSIVKTVEKDAVNYATQIVRRVKGNAYNHHRQFILKNDSHATNREGLQIVGKVGLVAESEGTSTQIVGSVWNSTGHDASKQFIGKVKNGSTSWKNSKLRAFFVNATSVFGNSDVAVVSTDTALTSKNSKLRAFFIGRDAKSWDSSELKAVIAKDVKSYDTSNASVKVAKTTEAQEYSTINSGLVVKASTFDDAHQKTFAAGTLLTAERAKASAFVTIKADKNDSSTQKIKIGRKK